MAFWHGLTKGFLEENIDVVIISDLGFLAVWNRTNLANWENENGGKKSYSKPWKKGFLTFLLFICTFMGRKKALQS